MMGSLGVVHSLQGCGRTGVWGGLWGAGSCAGHDVLVGVRPTQELAAGAGAEACRGIGEGDTNDRGAARQRRGEGPPTCVTGKTGFTPYTFDWSALHDPSHACMTTLGPAILINLTRVSSTRLLTCRTVLANFCWSRATQDPSTVVLCHPHESCHPTAPLEHSGTKAVMQTM